MTRFVYVAVRRRAITVAPVVLMLVMLMGGRISRCGSIVTISHGNVETGLMMLLLLLLLMERGSKRSWGLPKKTKVKQSIRTPFFIRFSLDRFSFLRNRKLTSCYSETFMYTVQFTAKRYGSKDYNLSCLANCKVQSNY